MQYILTEEEMQGFVKKQTLDDTKAALEKARQMIFTDEQCKEHLSESFGYCCDCPIGKIKDRNIRDAICTEHKYWPK
jgi:hypothetical protein